MKDTPQVPSFAAQVQQMKMRTDAHPAPDLPPRVTSAETKLKMFYDYLPTIPPPGFGNGCHNKLLGAANHGVSANLDQEVIFEAIRSAIPSGKRNIPDSEILAAIERAFKDADKPQKLWKPQSDVRLYDPKFQKDLIRAGKGITEKALLERSIPELREYPIEFQDALLLYTLYQSDDVLFIGDQYDRLVGTREQWIKAWSGEIKLGPFVIPNILSGKEEITKDGKPSFRCDDCVVSMPFAMAEFDDLPYEDQLAFWAAIDLPIAALIYSGGKSIHAWIRVGIQSREEWDLVVKGQLYEQRLIPLGVDRSCTNPSRLSRMPGYVREKTGFWQRLLYLQPEGKKVLS